MKDSKVVRLSVETIAKIDYFHDLLVEKAPDIFMSLMLDELSFDHVVQCALDYAIDIKENQ